MKKLLAVVVILLAFAQTGFACPQCLKCTLGAHHEFTCATTLITAHACQNSVGAACGCVIAGLSCYERGCCQPIPGAPSNCYDPSGTNCSNFACKMGTSPLAAQTGTLTLRTIALGQPSESLMDQRWFRDNTLNSEVGKHSRTFQLALEGLGNIQEEDSSLPDQAQRTIYVLENEKMVTVLLRREKARYIVAVDPASNTYNLLEMEEGVWRLMHHQANLNTSVVSGTY